jgi:hypothetical protein
MNSKIPLLSLLAVGLLFAAAWADPFELAPSEGVLVLRSGGVLTGKITEVGDRYYVTMDGAEIRIKRADVEHFCRTLDEAYQRRRAAIGHGRAVEHIDLAEWCLRQKLHHAASLELAQASSLDARHPRIALVQRRLALATAPPSFKVPETVAGANRTATDELDALVEGLPPGTVEMYTARVQPLLMNGCSAAACHGPDSNNRLRLERIQAGRPLTRRITHRNLKSTLECVDRENPSNSLLLTKPLAAHGPLDTAVLGERDVEKYQRFVEWVNLATSKSAGPLPTSVAETAAPLLQTIPDQPWPAAPNKAPPDDAKIPDPPDDSPADEQRKRPQRGAKLDQPLARDPFDPEIFNRQFSPAAKPSE